MSNRVLSQLASKSQIVANLHFTGGPVLAAKIGPAGLILTAKVIRGTNFGKIFYQNWSGQTDFRGDRFCCDSTLIGNNNNSLLQQISSLTAFQSSMVYRKQSRLMVAHGSSLAQPDRFFFFYIRTSLPSIKEEQRSGYVRLHGSELCSQVKQHARLPRVVKWFKLFHSNLTCCLAGKW